MKPKDKIKEEVLKEKKYSGREFYNTPLGKELIDTTMDLTIKKALEEFSKNKQTNCRIIFGSGRTSLERYDIIVLAPKLKKEWGIE